MAQERMDDWMEYARELAHAERELRIERWVFISIECKDEAGTQSGFIRMISRGNCTSVTVG